MAADARPRIPGRERSGREGKLMLLLPLSLSRLCAAAAAASKGGCVRRVVTSTRAYKPPLYVCVCVRVDAGFC